MDTASGIKATSSADFAHRLTGDLYTQEARQIWRKLDSDTVEFDESSGKPLFLEEGKVLFDAYDLDDLLLGPLEGVGIYVANGAIDLKTAYEMFSWYVVEVWECASVKEYVAWGRRQPNGEDVYDNLEKFYLDCKKYHEQKLSIRKAGR